jgi:hypothetical protein
VYPYTYIIYRYMEREMNKALATAQQDGTMMLELKLISIEMMDALNPKPKVAKTSNGLGFRV